MAQRKGADTMQNRGGADTGGPMAQTCFKVAARAPMFPTRGDEVSRVGVRTGCA